MNLNSQDITIQKPAQEVFNFLSDVKNFEALMPENISKFEVLGDDKFLFALKGMPEIILKKQESIPVSKIVLGAGGGKIDFSLTGHITEIDPTSCSVKLAFEGDFNPMMAMMIKGPISKFLETLSGNLPNAL
ncbi:MAG TPA: SRPBCC family protein [Flavobacteriaceae bacterium]|nr:SRPBCC family protein [Flavobacteriaceae bacterium]